MLGRKSPFPLILLPQFGGYWIEGTNHELSEAADGDQLQPLSPSTRTKLECNASATIYRKHFLGKVGPSVQHKAGNQTHMACIVDKKNPPEAAQQTRTMLSLTISNGNAFFLHGFDRTLCFHVTKASVIT